VYTPLHLATEEHFDAGLEGAHLGQSPRDEDKREDEHHHHPHSAHDHEVDLVVAAPSPPLPPVPISQIVRLEFIRPAPLVLPGTAPLETRLRDPPRHT